MRSLLFVDMLGVKSRWHQEGRPGAELAFQEFEGLVTDAITTAAQDNVLSGIIESDAAAIVCSSQSAAVSAGCALFRSAFATAATGRHRRPWLRGAIIPYTGHLSLRTTRESAANSVITSVYQPALLDAIAVEKAGFKGMRLLISTELVNDALRNDHCFDLENGQRLHVFKRTTHSGYPGRLDAGYDDVLWMASANLDEWKARRWAMARRLRYSSKDPDEFVQAAATQVLFHEYSAILGSLLGDHADHL